MNSKASDRPSRGGAAAASVLVLLMVAVPVALMSCGEQGVGPSDPTSELKVAVATAGDNVDPDGYLVELNGSRRQRVAVNGTVTFSGLTAGSHKVELLDLASNCAVTGSNPTSVTVATGSVSVGFGVMCAVLTGDLAVGVTTSGADLDPDGYMVTARRVEAQAVVAPGASRDAGAPDPGQSQPVGVNGTVTFPGLPAGEYTVQLTELAVNCTVNESNPVTVSLQANSTSTGAFTVTCDASVGNLAVAVSTTGSDPDPDGYFLTIDGGWSQPIGLNESATLTGLAVGDHTVELTGIDDNCTVSGTNPQTVAVSFGATATTAFAVICSSRVGDLEVTVSTAGSDLDPDGYTVTVDGGPSQAVGLNGAVTFTDLAEGDHSVALTGLSGNCSVSGTNPRTVTVPFGGAPTTAFGVTCGSRVGDLDVSVVTTGQDLDPDGYAVTVDGGPSQVVGVNGTVTFAGLVEGDHSVALTGLAGNCTVGGANPRTVTVPFGGTAATAFAVACSSRPGDLAVTVSTTGQDPDPDGYTVSVDGGPGQAVGVNGTVSFAGLVEGDHSVALTGLAGNCTVSGANPRTVTVPFGATATTAFAVACSSRVGDLAVTVSTTGQDPDPDGYTVTVDGGPGQSVGVSGTVTFAGLAEGDHSVTLTGLAGNCTVSGVNPRTVTVPFGGTATTTYAVTCVARVEDLEVTVNTTGSVLDPDGYTVLVDGARSQPVGVNGTVTFTGLAEGDHSVALIGLANNCEVTGVNPRTVTVVFGATATTVFAVTCGSLVGDLDVSTSTSGQDLDPDGYTVTVDGGPSQAVGVTGTVTFTGLAEGDHSVSLSELATNCTVSGANPRTVTVSFGGTATTTFAVTCVARVGDLVVSTSTTGQDLDPDGYTVSVDGGPSQAVGLNGTVTFTGLTEGDHSVALTGVAGNCTVSGANPQTVTVPFGGTAATAFTVTCSSRVGNLDVTTSTTGQDLDPDGYTVTVVGGPSQAVGPNGTVTFTGLAEGDHGVALSGLAGNCAVSGANPRTVTVPLGGTATTTFVVTCVALVGDLDVSTSTTGQDLDPDGYTVTVDGGPSQAVGPTGTVTFTGLADGDHSVALSGVAGNCTVSGTNPRTVTVPFGGSATMTFVVTCVALVGDLDVSTSTTGQDFDPDGYTVTVDGGPSRVVGLNETVTFTGLPEGDHSVALTDVAGNCAVSGANPRTVTVPFGATATTTFVVTCVALVGDLAVSTSTTGQDLDPDGYTVTVDGGPSQAVGVTGTVTFTGLAEGDHSVALSGVAGNCTVSGANPRTVTVPFGGSATTTFVVTCVALVGDLAVSTSTTGQDLDPDGYTVTVDGGPGQAVGVTGTVTFTGLAEGDHSVSLSELADNCAVGGANPRTVTVPFGGTATTAFTVTCAARLGDLDVTVGTTGSDLDPDGYTVTVDGGPSQAVGLNGTVTFTGLAEGDHSVALTGVAGNCSVSGANPQTVTVPFGGTAATAFTVTCSSRVGNLDAAASTTGQDLDPDGYTVTIVGGPSQPVGANGSVTFTGLAEGDHSVALSGVATNCTVSGANPRTVTVPFGGTAATTFTVTCVARVGDLDVSTNTTGQDLDPDGYTVTVDGGPGQVVGVNGTVTFTGLTEGDHSVALTGLATNCTVSGANPRTVTVVFAGTAATTFAVTCVARVGDLAVSDSTTGLDLDPDGYTVTVDGGPGQTVGVNGTVTFTGLTEGDHSVALTGLATNCTVSGANPRTVTVVFAGTVTTTFAVTCVARVGDLEVSTSTTGQDLDPDGYTVTVDGGANQTVGVSGTVTFTGLTEGDHSVALSGLANNCMVSGTNPRTVTVPFGGTAATAFTVTCNSRVGNLDVTASTTGQDLDPDGYTVTVDGGPSQTVGVNGTVTFTGLAEGDHTVALSGLATNCTVSGGNPRTVTVPFGGTTATTFTVTCVARLGDLDVSTSTTGQDLDPDGYTVTVDGGPSQAVGLNGTVTFTGLTEGSHSVALSGLASNCTVSGANPRTVTVVFAGTVTTTFGVTCVARVGDLDVSASTTGQDLDPDGYTVTVDGGPSQAVGVNASVTFTGLAEGNHSVALSGLATNCTVSGANPRTVTVVFAGTVTTTFDVTCVPRVGDLDVSTSTTGQDLDPDGYTVTVDGASSQAVGLNGTVTFTGLAEGSHSVALSGLASNCTVSGANPRTVTVVFAGTATTTFAVTCVARVGDLDVSASTTGQDLDPDGYTVTVDGGPSQAVGVNGTVTFTGLAEGDHSVALSGLASNCTVSGANPRTVTVVFGGTATTTFAVTCAARVGDLDVTASTTGQDLDPNGYTVTVDGGSSRLVGVNGSVTFTGLAEGDHSVALSGLASNCSVSGANPRTVTVPYGGTAATTFAVTCVMRVGDLAVSASTTGQDLDPDGYTVTVGGVPSQAVGVNGTVTFTGLDEGDHSVTLSGVASNCTVSGANPRTVTVEFAGTATTTFDVTCVPRVGDLAVSASTTGQDLDPDGYTVTVDGGSSQTVGVSGTVTFTGLDEGDHSVALAGLASNCTVSGANPRTVTVEFAGTATTTFDVTCVPRVGDLAVSASTTGEDLDSDGYTVTVDGEPSQTVGLNGTVTFTGLPEGDHSVALSGLAGNCTVSGANPRTVAVPFGGTATTTFAVTCVLRVGNLAVSASTTGQDLDGNGYRVRVDGASQQTVGVNGTVTYTGLTEGEHSVELLGVVSNCWVLSANPKTVIVPFNGTATTTFSVSCVELGVQIMVGAGDIASCGANSGDEGTAAILDTIPGTVFTAGDNANPNGTTDQFTNCYDPTWGRHFDRTRPTPGNRDYLTPGAAPYFAYFGSKAGTAGDGWYSYDVGNWHVIALNTEVNLDAGSAQHNWLVSDLAANSAACTIAIYHHPLFHSGDAGAKSRSRDAWDAMYAAGVEFVVSGHAQFYERFAPQAPDGSADPVNGIRQFIVGTGGHTLHSINTPTPNSEVLNNSTFGVIVFTLRNGSYDWQFIPVDGGTFTDSGSGSCH